MPTRDVSKVIEVKNIYKAFGDNQVLKNVSLTDLDAVTQVAQVMAYDGMLQMQSAYAEKVPAEDEPVMNPEDELYGQF